MVKDIYVTIDDIIGIIMNTSGREFESNCVPLDNKRNLESSMLELISDHVLLPSHTSECDLWQCGGSRLAQLYNKTYPFIANSSAALIKRLTDGLLQVI